MKKIKAVRVLYEDGSQEEWEGNGIAREHHTTILDDADTMKETTYFYVVTSLRVTDNATE